MTGKKKSSWVMWLLSLLVLGGAVSGGVFYFKQPKETAPDYKSTAAARGDITQLVTANGQLTPVVNVEVGSQVSGIIEKINVDFNSKVTNGQVIAQLEPATYQANVMQAEGELANARASLELAQVNARRAEELHKNSLIPRSDYDKAMADLHQAEAIVKIREASLKRSQTDLDRTTIFAPIDGVVISRNVEVGQTVAASFNTPKLFQIANDLSKMEIEAMVSEADVGGVEEGQRVTFTVDAFPTRQFQGEVKQVRYAPNTNQNVVSYTTIVEVNNADLKLRPGMTANASIITAQKQNVLRVPNAALRFRPPENPTAKTAAASAGAPASTNKIATAGASSGTNQPSFTQASPGGDGGPRPDREEMRRRFENMSPEERAAMRERMRARFGEGGPPGFGGNRGGGGFARATQDGPVTRTLYLLAKTNAPGAKEKPLAQAVTVKTGITDGSFTEVLEGLKEGDVVITGLNTPTLPTASMQAPPGGSPFGGRPFGGGFRPR
ncbi:MAG: efflux RND transporter periplasmic adaptor subunit [Chloroflexi bacterium]|nr:efflux RND transporter periplasmic adaptor subunit [Chloroflexota bacterium]